MGRWISQEQEDQIPKHLSPAVRSLIKAHLRKENTIMEKKPWNELEIQQLRNYYKDNWISLKEIAEKLGRTVDSVSSKAKNLGIHKAQIGGLNPKK